MKKTPVIVAILTSCLALGAIPAFGQKLYPLQGPLASQTLPPVFTGQVKRPMFGLGSEVKLLKSWTVANGEVLEGRCTEVTAASANTKSTGAPESYPPQPNLAFAWDAIFGSGYFAAHILGGKVWQGIFKGDQGTVLQVEMREQLGPERNNDRYRGAAVDNKGNVYKVVW
jgi:hypothetical protein